MKRTALGQSLGGMAGCYHPDRALGFVGKGTKLANRDRWCDGIQ